MDILQAFIGEKATADLITGLLKRGFSHAQAGVFLSQAGSRIVQVMQEHGMGSDTESIVEYVDTTVIASTLGMNRQLAITGVEFLVPNIVSQLGHTAACAGVGEFEYYL